MATIAVLTERLCRGYGVDLVVDRWSTALADRGHDVTVYANLVDDTYGPVQGSSYEVIDIGQLGHPALPVRELRPVSRLLPNAASAALQADVVIAHTPPYFRLTRSGGPPVICVDYGSPPGAGFTPAVRANFVYRRATETRLWFPAAAHVVSISSFLADAQPAAVQRHTTTVHLGADHLPEPHPGRAALRAEWGVDTHECVALYVGRFGHAAQPYKGTRDLAGIVRSAQQLSGCPVRLVVVGLGTDADATELRDNGVIVESAIGAARLAGCYHAADVYVTATRWEGFDLPAAEAQAAGLPVAALDVGAHREVVANGLSGMLTRTVDDLATALATLAADETQRHAMGAAANRWARQFTWQRSGDLFADVVDHVLARHR